MAIDRALLQGAKAVGASMRPADSQDRFSKNFDAVYDETVKKRSQALKEKKAIEQKAQARVQRYMDRLPTTKGMEKIPPAYKQKVAQFAINGKNEYAAAARSLADLDPTSVEYQDAIDTMNRVKTSFETLNDQFTTFTGLKQEFAQDMENGDISSGNNPIDVDFLSRATTDELDVEFSPYGELVFKEGESQYTLDQMPNYFNKDYGAMKEVLALNKEIFNGKQNLQGAIRDNAKYKLSTLIRKGGRETALSLATDDFLEEGGLAITDQDLLYNPERTEELQAKVTEAYMTMLENSAAEGKRKADEKFAKLHPPKQPNYELDNIFIE